MAAVSALYSFKSVVAAPLANVTVVPVPKFTSAEVLSEAVGIVASGAAVAPPKVRVLSAVYPVAVLPY